MHYLQQDFSLKFEYKVFFGSRFFDTADTVLADFLEEHSDGNKKILFLIDSGVNDAFPGLRAQIREYFRVHSGIKLADELVLVAGGEQAKNDPAQLERVLAAINEQKIDRHSYLAIIGGGAVLDMGGYAAAIAHRGIKLLRFPTTVLSQNDSGIGVKNGINYFQKKNFLGTFSTPAAVFNDDQFLTSLDDRNWRSGMAEAIKVALIKDASFFDWIEAHASALASREMEPMNALIVACAKLHMEHIGGADPFESGSSRPLDFGHWTAHKIEQLTNFELLHGEAVAIGIALDVIYSGLLGLLSETAVHRVLDLLVALGFDMYHDVLSAPELIFPGLEEFREHLGGRLTIMLLASIGQGINMHEIDQDLFNRSIQVLAETKIIR